MKKILSLLLTAVFVLSLGVMTVSAAGGINASEQKVLDKLSSKVTSSGKTFAIPVNYVNQAKNYFLTIDMTESQAETIIAKITEGEKIVKAEEDRLASAKKEIDLRDFTFEDKKKILELGQEACKIVNLTLTYENKQVKIVDNATSKIVFIDDPIIKVTGSNSSYTPAIIVAAAIVLTFGAAIVVSKKVTVR